MARLGFGIVGTGMIAGVIADALAKSTKAKLVAVSSRRIDNARSFTANRQGAAPVQGVDGLLAQADVDAVYIATPTIAKEEIALAAIESGKHVLFDKPFIGHASAARIAGAAAAKGLVLMDATHFVHHPRTAIIKAAIAAHIGTPRSLHTSFYAPISDRSNIRFDAKQEPMTVIGDMAWYSMRAIVEYLRPTGRVTKVVTVPERDPETGAVVRASGLISFEGGEVSTFDVGYNASTALMGFQLIGTAGVIEMDDFVLDWNDSFPFKNPHIETGYVHRTGETPREDATFIATPTGSAQQVTMIENFAELAASGNAAQRAAFVESSLKTQEYLDAIWAAALR